MKKSLVLAMALAMGVTASAYAANPFSDVPAGHWAYDAVDKLAAAGVVDGMGDGTFNGDKTMTRYEMAQIVAKAMAKGANVEKLAAEFADELDQLGVRVAKLEKKSDNLTVTGQIRYDYIDTDGDDKNGASKRGAVTNRLRTRLFLNGQINEDWAYHARIQNDQNIGDNAGNDTTSFNRAYVTGKLGGVKVSAGRQAMFLGDGNIYDDTMDTVVVSYGKKVNFSAYYGKPTEDLTLSSYNTANKTLGEENNSYKYGKVWGVNVNSKIGVVGVDLGYDEFKDGTMTTTNYGSTLSAESDYDTEKNGIFHIGVNGNIGKLYLGAIYLKSNMDDEYTKTYDGSTSGFVVTAKYGASKAAVVNSWGVEAKYYNQGYGTFAVHTMNGDYKSFLSARDGFTGYKLGAEYTFAKNIQGFVEYYDLKGKDSDLARKTWFGRVQFTF